MPGFLTLVSRRLAHNTAFNLARYVGASRLVARRLARLGLPYFRMDLVFVFEIQKHLDIDSCLDKGGGYNYEKSLCEFSETNSR